MLFERLQLTWTLVWEHWVCQPGWQASVSVFLKISRGFCAVLPKVVSERKVQLFKFWFNGALQDGIHFENELYYRLQDKPMSLRSRLYQLACRLSLNGADVILTISNDQCGLWANLRNQQVAALSVSERLALPSIENLLADRFSYPEADTPLPQEMSESS